MSLKLWFVFGISIFENMLQIIRGYLIEMHEQPFHTEKAVYQRK